MTAVIDLTTESLSPEPLYSTRSSLSDEVIFQGANRRTSPRRSVRQAAPANTSLRNGSADTSNHLQLPSNHATDQRPFANSNTVTIAEGGLETFLRPLSEEARNASGGSTNNEGQITRPRNHVSEPPVAGPSHSVQQQSRTSNLSIHEEAPLRRGTSRSHPYIPRGGFTTARGRGPFQVAGTSADRSPSLQSPHQPDPGAFEDFMQRIRQRRASGIVQEDRTIAYPIRTVARPETIRTVARPEAIDPRRLIYDMVHSSDENEDDEFNEDDEAGDEYLGNTYGNVLHHIRALIGGLGGPPTQPPQIRQQPMPQPKYDASKSHPHKLPKGFRRDVIPPEDIIDLDASTSCFKTDSEEEEVPVCAGCDQELFLGDQDNHSAFRPCVLKCGHLICAECASEGKKRFLSERKAATKAKPKKGKGKGRAKTKAVVTEMGKEIVLDEDMVMVQGPWKGCPVVGCDGDKTAWNRKLGADTGLWQVFV